MHFSEPLRRIRDEQHGLASFARSWRSLRSRLSLRSSIDQTRKGQPARQPPEVASARSPLLTEAHLNTTVSVARAGKARSLVSPARGPAEAETPQRRSQKQDAKTKLAPQHAAQTREWQLPYQECPVGDCHGAVGPRLLFRCVSPVRPRGTSSRAGLPKKRPQSRISFRRQPDRPGVREPRRHRRP